MYLFKSLLAALATGAAIIAFGVILSRWPFATAGTIAVLCLTVLYAANGAFSDGRK